MPRKALKLVLEMGAGDERVDYVDWDDSFEDMKSRSDALSDHVWNEIDAYTAIVILDDDDNEIGTVQE